MLASNTLMRLAEGAKGLAFNRHLITGCTGMKGSVGTDSVVFMSFIFLIFCQHFLITTLIIILMHIFQTKLHGLVWSGHASKDFCKRVSNHFGMLTNKKMKKTDDPRESLLLTSESTDFCKKKPRLDIFTWV